MRWPRTLLVGVGVGAVLAGLLGLLLWPDQGIQARPSSPSGAPGGGSEAGSVASWPARGELAGDPRLALAAEVAWRTAAQSSGLMAPGPEVDVVYGGRVDDHVLLVLRSWSAEGTPVVALARSGPDGNLSVVDARAVPGSVPWLTLPGAQRLRLLVAPDLTQNPSLVLRRDDSLWSPVAIGEDGVTAPLRSLGREPPIVGVVEVRDEVRDVLDVAVAVPGSLLPAAAPVVVVEPSWGRRSAPSFAEYDAALFAAPGLPGAPAEVAVLTAEKLPGGAWAALLEYRDPGRLEEETVMVVPTGPDGRPEVGWPVTRGVALAAGVVSRPGGRLMVVVTARPEVSRVEVRGVDGATLVDARGSTAVVLPPQTSGEVVVWGRHQSGYPIESLRLTIPPEDAQARSP